MTIVPKGIPSKEQLWLDNIRTRQDEWKYHKDARLELEQILETVFPSKYREKTYTNALIFMQVLLKEGMLKGDDVGKLCATNPDINESTLYKVVIPRLKRVGMIQTERVDQAQVKSKKIRARYYMPSKQFGNLFRKVGDEWNAIIETSRRNVNDKGD